MEGSNKKRVAIACQGGGSHTAFTAGVLEGLLQAEQKTLCQAHGYAASHEAKGYDQPTPALKQKQHHDEIEWHQRGSHD